MTPHMPRAALTIALTGALIGGAAFAAPAQALPSGRAQAAAPSAPASSAPASSTPPASALKPAVGATTDQNGFEIDANGVLLRYTGSASDITIPGKATAIADEALRGTTAERITVPATVRTIGDRAFADAQQLKALVFEDTADHPSQLTAIGAEAAANTPALTEVAVPSKAASLGEGAFADSGITRLSLPDSLTSIPARLVKNSSLLTEAVVGNAVTEIGEAAFSAAHSLKGLSVRQADGSTAPGFPSSLVTIGQEAFNATGLGSVDLPASVRTIGDAAFNAIERLSHVGLNEGLVSIGSSAFRTTGITEIVIPDSVTTVGSSAFSECSALTSAHIGRGVEAGQLSDAFTSSRQLSGFTVAPDNASYEAVDGVLYSKDHTSLVVYPAGKGSGTTYTVLDETTRIESGAFNSAPLKGVVLPSSLRSIGDWAFSGSYLESLVLPKAFETFGECAFSGMPSLARVDLGGTKTIGEQAFLASHALQEVDFRADLGRLTTISAYAFAETGLVSAVLPDSVTSLGDGAFTRSTELKEVHLGSGLTELGARVFTGTTALASLSVDPSNPVLSLDGSVLYQQGNDGSHLVYAALAAPLPAYSVRPGTAQIDEAAFKGHATLREVVVPEGVKAIGAQAFAGIHELTDVALPDSLEEVSDAFAGTQVETIEFGARIRTIEEAAFEGGLPVRMIVRGGKDGTFASPEEWVPNHTASAFFGEGMKRIAYTHGNFPQTLVVPSTLEELVLTTGLLTAEQLAEAHVYVAADRDSAAWSVAKTAVEKAGLDPASHLHRYVDPALSLSSPAIDRAGDASKVQVKAGETIEVMATMTGGVAVGREARAIEVGPGGAETVVSDWNSASDSDPSLDDADGGAISSWVRFTWVPSVDGASLRVESRDITFRVVTGVLGSALPPAPEPGEGQWVQDAGGWWYRFADGTYPRGQALVIDGGTYRFDQSGHALTGWVRDGGYWFHHGASGAMSTGWLVDGGAWYYLIPSWGAMAIGWVEDGGEWYYLNAAGHMTTGWQKIEGSWFYLGDSGKMATGWRHIDGYWHFFEPTGELRH
ncbi:leucine-rich repeat protein [Pauljensenia hongkongensis]|nr:leucine-rich repeat protein [Pauljensenia hongkongensis]